MSMQFKEGSDIKLNCVDGMRINTAFSCTFSKVCQCHCQLKIKSTIFTIFTLVSCLNTIVAGSILSSHILLQES